MHCISKREGSPSELFSPDLMLASRHRSWSKMRTQSKFECEFGDGLDSSYEVSKTKRTLLWVSFSLCWWTSANLNWTLVGDFHEWQLVVQQMCTLRIKCIFENCHSFFKYSFVIYNVRICIILLFGYKLIFFNLIL